jgi:mycobactin polyketide synthetase MbtC
MPVAEDRFAAAGDPVVIVGMGLEAPGGTTPPRRIGSCWSVRELLAGSRRNGFKEIHDRGGFLTGAATFDPEFFGISPREAVAMDPQQRVALRVSWRPLENSGINPDDMAGQTWAAI